MGFLNNLEAEEAPTADPASATRSVRVTLDITRNVVVAVLLLALLAAIVILYAMQEGSAARILVDVLIAVLASALGVNFGERGAAKEIQQQLGGG